jgi:hypothetical protein
MRHLFGILAGLAILSAARAVTIDIDYSYDSSGFFTANPEAKVALEKAATDVGAAITRSLPAVTTSTFTGTSGSGTVQIQWSLQFNNPSTGDAVTLNSFSFAADHFTVYVGARTISGGSDLLGQTLPATPHASFPTAEAATNADYFNALALVTYESNAALTREGYGPVFFSTTSQFPSPFDSETHPATFQTGLLAAAVAFSDNVSQWHFDPNTAVEVGKFDFYTVAAHELFHALGFGSASISWAANVSGSDNWIGASAASMPNGGVAILDATADDHIAQGTMSKTIVGDVDQEVAMDGTVTAGERKLLTTLDRLFLHDIGYDPSASPTPWPTPALSPTPTPTPTPTATPEETPAPTPPAPPILKGKAKLSTTLPKVTLTGKLSAPGAYVVYKIGNGKFTKARGGASWKIVLKLKPGKNLVTIASFDPATGLTSTVKKIVIVKK